MRISKLFINGFGKFNDVSFDIEGPVTLFYGHNEAGKSTIMGFVRAILFGFPTRRNMKDRYEPLSGGQHGGMVVLVDEQGESYRIERYEGILKVTLDDGTIKGELFLHKLLGELTPDVFQNLFAFSLSELQEISTLQSDEISGYLFNAGTGAGAGRILEAERKITQEMEQLFKPRGRTQEIQLLLKDLEETKNDIQSSKASLGMFNQKGEDLAAIAVELQRIEQQISESNAAYSWTKKCLKTHESWMMLEEFRRELDEFPRLDDFPEDAPNRFDKLVSEQEALLLNLERSQTKLADLKQRRDQIVVTQSLIDLSSELENKIERLSSVQDAKEAIVELKIDLRNSEEELERTLRQIDKEWTVKELSAFSTSVMDREQVLLFRDRIQDLQNKTQLKQWEQYNLELQQLQQQQAKLMQSSRTASRSSNSMNQRTKQKGSAVLMIWMTVLLSVLLPAYLLWERQWGAAFVGLAIGAVIIGLLLKENANAQQQDNQVEEVSESDIAEQLNRLNQQISAKEHQVQQLFSSSSVGNEAVATAESHISLYDTTNSSYEQWNKWLIDHHLRRGLSAETVLEIFRIAEQGLQQLSRIDKLETKLKSLQAFTFSFEQQARDSFQLTEEADIVVSLRQLKREVDKQRSLLDEQTRLDKQIEEQAEELQHFQMAAKRIAERIEQLWLEADAQDETQFRLNVRHFNRKLHVQEEMRHTEVFLDHWVGSGRRNDLDEQLRNNDYDQLTVESEQQQEQINELTETINQLREQRGKLQSEMEQLKSGHSYTSKLQQYEEQKASFGEFAGQWATKAFCLELFKRAKEMYEREKQPGVLKKASDYFAVITNHQFTRVMAPIGEKRILVERASKEVVDTAWMSRGTAEQLYLAMRFALADEYAAKVTLPIIMDDIFVNFDQLRLQYSIDLLDKVSQRQQIILFTCHPHVRDAVVGKLPETRLVNI